jgi:hypothetical protein
MTRDARCASALQRSLIVCLVAALPRTAHAGGNEFPAGGTRSLGRGGAGMARADDPSVMVRNPALLADLWDDQALLGGHLVLTGGCFQATGAYGWNTSGRPDVSELGNGPLLLNSPAGGRDLQGNPLSNYANEPYPEVCLRGKAQALPQLAVAMKLSPDLGVGLGFFPPDVAGMSQWGNSDGTVDTPNGKRPNPMRFAAGTTLTSHSYFSLLAAFGYRAADWLRVGAGLQWTAVAYDSRSWAVSNVFDTSVTTRADAFGRDLFIPGIVASVAVKPIDSLDIAFGFRWSDRVKNNAKVDITTSAFGTGALHPYLDPNGQVQNLGGSVPTTTNNQIAAVNAPPIYVPQLSFGLRYADRLQPEPKDRAKAHAAAGRSVQDAMQTERFDLELDGVYYFNSVNDATVATITGGTVTINQISSDGTIVPPQVIEFGHCRVPLVDKMCPLPSRDAVTSHHGMNQLSLRLGGDYNVLPGLLALRAGVSYESAGQKPQYLEFTNYLLQRVGLHIGLTLRVAQKTDISLAFSHFLQEHVRLQVNDTQASYPARYKTPAYHFRPGAGVTDANGANADAKNGFAGVAEQPVPNGSTRTVDDIGPDFVNAGDYYVTLDAASLTLTQHF